MYGAISNQQSAISNQPEARRLRSSFTLVELLATVAIIAVLSVIAGFFVVSYINWSQNLSDQRTLLVLNDALTRYKGEGGSLAALTSGADISHVITALKTPVNWAGMTHQFLQSAFTAPARSIASKNNSTDYKFTQYYTYISESGGLVNGGNNLTHGLVSFTSTGTTTWTVPAGVYTVQALVVAGGGGGGDAAQAPGGGGAGGVIYNTSYSVTAGAGITVTVGTAGVGATTTGNVGANGGNSVFGSLTAVGGGGGGTSSINGSNGGSGGGGGGTSVGASNGGSGTAGQGYAGGNGVAFGTSGHRSSGGGGGAGAVGGIAMDSVGGAGGVGISCSITGSPVFYGGGGGGSAATGGAGGNGGGGAGGSGGVGSNATANTGGGGGGGFNTTAGGNGGSGVVIVSY